MSYELRLEDLRFGSDIDATSHAWRYGAVGVEVTNPYVDKEAETGSK